MTQLYRNLLYLLSEQFFETIKCFREQVRSFKPRTDDPTMYFDVGVIGFWNLLFEIVLTVFSLCCLMTGIALITVMAIVFYPLHAIARFGSLLVRGTRDPTNTSN